MLNRFESNLYTRKMISAAERRAKIEKLRRDREAKEEERKEREKKRL